MSKNEVCKLEGCDRSVRARGYCSTHYSRWHRSQHGRIRIGVDVPQVHPRGSAEQVEYRAAHNRLDKARGKASTYWCVDQCGRQARQWSLEPGTEDVLISNDAYHIGYRYSLDIYAYSPRCDKCHIALDRQVA